jgi:hypothetical protein
MGFRRCVDRRWWALAAVTVLLAFLSIDVSSAGAQEAQAQPPGSAGSWTVVRRTGDDHAAGSLRAAVDRFDAGGTRAGVIVLVPGVYALTLCGPTDETNQSGDLDVSGSGSLTVIGLGDVTIKQTCAGERVIDDHGVGRLVLVHVAVTGGDASGSDPTVPVTGGGVRAAGPVTLWGARLEGNRATAPKGADATATAKAQPGGAVRGGGIAAAGPVTSVGSTLSSNTATAGAGGNDAGQTDDGVGGSASGGAISTPGAVTMVASTLRGNQALGGAGSIPPPSSFPIGASGGPARGGAIDAGAVTVRGTTFDENEAVGGDAMWTTFSMAQVPVGNDGGTADGGAIAGTGPISASGSRFHANQAIEGSGAHPAGSHGGAIATSSTGDVSRSTFDANVANRHQFSEDGSAGGAVSTGADLTVVHTTFTHNLGELGGAVHAGGPLTIEGDTFTLNRGTHGGAVHADSTVTVTTSRFSTNHATTTVASAGGALMARGTVSIVRSSFADNHIDHDASSFPPFCRSFLTGLCHLGDFGAHGGAAASAQAITATDSTFSGNSVQGGFEPTPNSQVVFGTATGGALAAPTLTVRDSTIVDSAATQEGFDLSTGPFTGAGAGEALDADVLTLDHVTLTDSSGPSPSPPLPGFVGSAIKARQLTIGATVIRTVGPSGASECGPGVSTSSQGYNYIDDPSCMLTGVHDTVTSTDPLLGPLADNGGPTLTRLPGPGSPLIDAIPTTVIPLCTGIDQRGISRPQGAGCDIGSVEAKSP